MAKVRVNIKVDTNGNVTVKSNKRRPYEKNKDTITFTSRRKETAIRIAKSAFAGVPNGTVFKTLRPPKGPFLVIKDKGEIECGLVIGGRFQQWAEAGEFVPPC